MTRKHKPHIIGNIIFDLMKGLSPKQIYQIQYNRGMTTNRNFISYWHQTNKKIVQMTGKNYDSFCNYYIKINYVKNAINVGDQLETMAIDKEQKRKEWLEKLEKNLDKLDNDQLKALVKGFAEFVDEEFDVDDEKIEKITNRKCKLVKKFDEKQSRTKSITKITKCLCANISERTLNYRIKIDAYDKPLKRKIRKDSLVNDLEIQEAVKIEFEDQKRIPGGQKLYKLLQKKGFKHSLSTIHRIKSLLYLFASSITIRKKVYEEKNIKATKDYLLTEKELKNYKPGEVVSLDFSMIYTLNGIIWMHGARDVISGKVYFVYLSKYQTAEITLEHIKKLPPTIKIINTDHGTNYMSKLVQDYLKLKGIKHSTGRPGCSWYNRWIEEFWKRIKGEWFSQYSIKRLSNTRVQNLIVEYVDYFNNKRINSVTNWMSPIKYTTYLLGIN